MSELRRKLGTVQFNRLCDIAGGTRVPIPKYYGKPPNGGRDTSRRLDRMFGSSLAILLVFHFGDTLIRVPKHRGNASFDKHKLNRLAKRSDLSANEIARRVGCDCRTVELTRQRQQQAKGIAR